MPNSYLIVVDMQNDFIDGALGTPEAQAIVEAVVERARAFEGCVVFTRDTHGPNYAATQEGRNLPVPHCIKGTQGWELAPALDELQRLLDAPVFEKPSFGSLDLARWLVAQNNAAPIDSIELCGLCTDICVVSNALTIKALPCQRRGVPFECGDELHAQYIATSIETATADSQPNAHRTCNVRDELVVQMLFDNVLVPHVQYGPT